MMYLHFVFDLLAVKSASIGCCYNRFLSPLASFLLVDRFVPVIEIFEFVVTTRCRSLAPAASNFRFCFQILAF